MKSNILGCLLLIGFLLSWVSCSSPSNATSVKSQPCTGDEVSAPPPEGNPSWAWSDIVVGSSTRHEVATRYGEPESTVLWPNDQEPQACIHYYKNDDDFFSVWFAGDRVIGLEFRNFDTDRYVSEIEVPETFEEAKTLFGQTQLVGWSERGYGFRSVLWENQGVQAEISIHTDKDYIRIIRYFAPMSSEDFHSSPWARLVLDKNLTWDTDLIDMGPKDPFEWDD